MRITLRIQPGETEEQFIKRVVQTARRPDPDQLARLAALLRSGRVGAHGIRQEATDG